MSAEVIQFSSVSGKHCERRTKQRELEEARRGGYFTNAEFAGICEAASPEERLRIWRTMQEVTAEAPRQLPPPLTTTAKNSRLRSARRDAWRKAEAATRYWRALLDFTDAASIAQMYDVKEAHAMPTDHEHRHAIIGNYRAALGRQLLTPAPDVTALNWKRQRAKKTYIGADKDDIAAAIAEDAAFLKAHPTRKCRPSA